MDHIHNETVLNFLKAHKDNRNIMEFIQKQNSQIEEFNKALDENYIDYFDYLESNIGDDASFSLAELKSLLNPGFEVKLTNKDKEEFEYDSFIIGVDELEKPVYIKDEGSFFSIWSKKERIDIPVRFLKRFIKFLKDNKIYFNNEYG